MRKLKVATYQRINLLNKNTELILEYKNENKDTVSKYETKDWR